ncbi:MAG: T9SS type A sorting domain-containing protein, partial [Sphingobacteriaceae bacterium]
GKGDKGDIVFEKRAGPAQPELHTFNFNEDERVVDMFADKDSLGKKISIRLKQLREVPEFAFDNRADGGDFRVARDVLFDGGTQVKEFRMGRAFDNFSRPNSQSFNYTSTDDEGISTHVSYMVSDASAEKLSQIAGVDKVGLAIKDIHLSPEFSTGKTVLSFSQPVNKALDVQFKDSQGKVLWSENALTQTRGNFSKTFNLGLNGVYYLQVKSGGDIAVKRIVKED